MVTADRGAMSLAATWPISLGTDAHQLCYGHREQLFVEAKGGLKPPGQTTAKSGRGSAPAGAVAEFGVMTGAPPSSFECLQRV